MARNVEYVVDSAHNPDVAIFIMASTVASKVTTGNIMEVSLLEAIMVAVKGAQHGWPWLTHHKQSALIRTKALAVASHDVWYDSR